MSETWETFLLWIIRLSASFAFLANTCFYCFLCCRWKLAKNIHWLLCNFAISELIRALAVFTFGILWEKLLIMNHIYPAYEDEENMYSNTSTVKMDNNFLDSYNAIIHAKSILLSITDTCLFTTDLFVLLIITQFYFHLKSPWSSEKLNFRHIILVLTIWLCCVLYTVFMFIFGDAINDQELVVYHYYATAAIIFNGIYFLCTIILLILAYRLFSYNSIELWSNVCMLNDTVMRNEYFCRQNSIRFLIGLILFIIPPSFVAWLESLNEITHFIEGFTIPDIIREAKSVYMFLFGSFWPFIWIYLDSGMGNECRKASKYLKLSTKFQTPLAKTTL